MPLSLPSSQVCCCELLRAENVLRYIVTALAHPSAIFVGRCCSNVPMPRIETLWAAVENCSPPSHYILQWNLRRRDILGAMLLSLVERSSLSRRVIFFPLLSFIQLFHDHTHPSPFSSHTWLRAPRHTLPAGLAWL